MLILILALVVLSYIVFVRYFPVKGIPCVALNKMQEDVIKLDVRDYNEAAKHSIGNAITIPVAYLKRHYEEIPNQRIYLIASDPVEKNIGIRILQQRNYNIVGYTIINSNCPCKKWFAKLV